MSALSQGGNKNVFSHAPKLGIDLSVCEIPYQDREQCRRRGLFQYGPDKMMLYLPGILAMATIVVVSNILVQFLFGNWLTWGAFTYPFAFLVTDVMNRVYGVRAARRVVFVGFLTGIVCSLIGTQVMLQGDGFSYPAVTLRIAVGSGIAFLAAQLIDVGIFDRLRQGVWWRAPVVSTLIGSTIDTALFFTIAFSGWLAALEPANDVSWANEMLPLLGAGPVAPLWMSLAVADWCVKVAIALIALIPFRLIVARLSTPAPSVT